VERALARRERIGLAGLEREKRAAILQHEAAVFRDDAGAEAM